ncbi:HD domain-containing phosphohydrolase [Thiomicrorhabdus sediminis]|uniref:Response regulator n=1 Tax=Thiomicrorhabdus sediminis TaxID=2580412 RepID=A0A4P9K5Q1_9GAMM|nr:HD domain-containing phosphohydrolase [Thiomicrorhabdus sediminis]QCU89800.1 response regulator [Thiomicrorhabdus sediminis]
MTVEPKKAKVLIIDDKEVNLKLVQKLLMVHQYEDILTTSNPLDVDQIITEHSVDLFLLDINMPVRDGFAVLEIIKKHYGERLMPPVIMVTAQIDSAMINKALDLGASDYITKPFNQKELISRCQIHLENWLLKRSLIDYANELEQRVQERTKEIEKAHLEVVYRLGRAAEYRDNETGNHVKRVSMFAELLARKAGLSEEQCRLIKLAAPMHDLGKIGVSDNILLKPGKLDNDEYSLMKQHVEMGADILANSEAPILQYAYEIALTHHEQYNGKGYPKGLSGDQIPISGRIVAIVDVFDALTSERPYKRAWSIEETIDLLVEEKGKHFDPYLVDCFVELLPEIREISEQLKDDIG